MTPPCQSFKAKALPTHIQVGPDHRVRKTADGRRIDLLRDCELFGLLQYDCQVRDPELRESQIECWPVQRLFRRYILATETLSRILSEVEKERSDGFADSWDRIKQMPGQKWAFYG